jgi:hypothetical protein
MESKSTVFIQQEDGTLRPVQVPEALAIKTAIYLQLRALGLTPEEIIGVSEMIF